MSTLFSSFAINDDTAENCSLIITPGRNTTGTFEFERGWEGIPTNFIINTVIFIVSLCHV